MERPKIGYCQRIDEAPSILIVNTARLHELIEYSVWAEQELSKLHQPNVSGSFNHETISKIRNSQSDAEARRIIANHVKNYR